MGYIAKSTRAREWREGRRKLMTKRIDVVPAPPNATFEEGISSKTSKELMQNIIGARRVLGIHG